MSNHKSISTLGWVMQNKIANKLPHHLIAQVNFKSDSSGYIYIHDPVTNLADIVAKFTREDIDDLLDKLQKDELEFTNENGKWIFKPKGKSTKKHNPASDGDNISNGDPLFD